MNLIEKQESLERAIELIRPASEIGVDIEADSLYHYFEKICLIQMNPADTPLVVDPLNGLDLSPLIEQLGGKLLIFHGADYDLRLLRKDFSFVPYRIFDTMKAAQLLGFENIGLASLVEKYFGVHLSKSSQKLDWSERPLKKCMLDYAARDVIYLPELKDRLEKELLALGRLHWLKESCEQIVASALADTEAADPDKEWRFKGTSALSGKSLALARVLWYWREAEAKKTNRPAFKVVGNQTMVELAAHAAHLPNEEVFKRVNLPRTFAGRRLAELRKVLDEGRDYLPARWPMDKCKGKNHPHRETNPALIERLREIRDLKSRQNLIEPSLLASRAALLEIAARKPRDLETMRALRCLMKWQIGILGEAFLEVLWDSKR
ncbi:MAG: HRDC domain-containing protein [bacterium]